MTAAPTSIDVALLDPRALVSHPRNVRADLGDLAGLTASIAEQGVIEPLTVVPLPEGGHMIVAGHRRAAAAVEAGVERVPCVVRPDLAAAAGIGSSEVVEHVAAMLSENLHREGLTAVEEARGIQAMIDLGGMSIAKVAKATGLGRKRVALAAGVARLDQGTADMVDDFGLDLEQAAVVATFADAPETSAKLAVAAKEGPGRFAHAVEQAKRDRKVEQAFSAKMAEFEAASVAIATSVEYGGPKNRRLVELTHDGSPLTEETHQACPGRAVHVQKHWNGVDVTEVCVDYSKHGHADRYPSSSSSSPAKPETEEEKAEASTERRRVIENNKAMAAANSVRRVWLKELLARRSAPAGVLRFAVEEISVNPGALRGWLGSESAIEKDVDDALGVQKPVRPWSMSASSVEKRTTLTTGEKVTDARLPLQLLAHVAGGIESNIPKDAWRREHTRSELVRWFTFLAGLGYTLSDVEQQIVDGADR